MHLCILFDQLFREFSLHKLCNIIYVKFQQSLMTSFPVNNEVMGGQACVSFKILNFHSPVFLLTLWPEVHFSIFKIVKIDQKFLKFKIRRFFLVDSTSSNPMSLSVFCPRKAEYSQFLLCQLPLNHFNSCVEYFSYNICADF